MEEYKITFQYLRLDVCCSYELRQSDDFCGSTEETKEKIVIEACKKLRELVLGE